MVPFNDVVKKIAFHVFRILHGTSLINNTNKIFRDLSELMCTALFALLRSYAANFSEPTESPAGQQKRINELVECCGSMKEAVLQVKQKIPSEHRILAEEAHFDMGAEDRRIRVHLKTLCKVLGTELGQSGISSVGSLGQLGGMQTPFVLEDIEEEVKPFILKVMKEALTEG